MMAGPASAQVPPIEFLKESQPPKLLSMVDWASYSVTHAMSPGATASQLQPHKSYEQIWVPAIVFIVRAIGARTPLRSGSAVVGISVASGGARASIGRAGLEAARRLSLLVVEHQRAGQELHLLEAFELELMPHFQFVGNRRVGDHIQAATTRKGVLVALQVVAPHTLPGRWATSTPLCA